MNKKFNIDRILGENEHTVLRLPPYHPDLNPIKMVWAAIKGYFAKKKINWNANQVMELVREMAGMMKTDFCAECCPILKKTIKK